MNEELSELRKPPVLEGVVLVVTSSPDDDVIMVKSSDGPTGGAEEAAGSAGMSSENLKTVSLSCRLL